jgi:hypothetical protein
MLSQVEREYRLRLVFGWSPSSRRNDETRDAAQSNHTIDAVRLGSANNVGLPGALCLER